MNNQTVSEILTLPVLILGDTWLFTGAMLSWRPWHLAFWHSLRCRQGILQFQGASVPETKSKTVYAEAGLTLKVEFTKQPSLLFVPNEPALHLEFVLSLKPWFCICSLAGSNQEGWSFVLDRSSYHFLRSGKCSWCHVNLGGIFTTLQKDSNFIFFKCEYLCFCKF